MPGLVLKMPPGDRIVVNGSVIENAGRSAKLRILSPNTNLLRLRDAIDPMNATTPLARIAHAVQLAVAGEAGLDDVRAQVVPALDGLARAWPDAAVVVHLRAAREHLLAGDAYRALRCLQGARERDAAMAGASRGAERATAPPA